MTIINKTNIDRLPNNFHAMPVYVTFEQDGMMDTFFADRKYIKNEYLLFLFDNSILKVRTPFLIKFKEPS